jgi:hypothetical protein
MAMKSRTYTVEVIGRDAAGNWQDKAAPSTVSWTLDTTLPVVTAE